MAHTRGGRPKTVRTVVSAVSGGRGQAT